MSNRVLKIHKATGEVLKTYSTIGQAAKANGISKSLMCQRLRRKDLGQQSYFFVREKEWEGIGYFPKNKNNRPIIVVKGNAVIWFPCRKAMFESMNICKETLYKVGYMLYRLKTVMGHIPNEPKVLDADGAEIKPGDELYYTTNTFLAGKRPRIIESVHTEKNPGGGNEPWVRFHSGWEYAHILTHQNPETLQDVIDDLYKQVPNQEFGHIIRVPIDLIGRLEAIQKRMGGDA
jgi:hypothetical protein